jgi:hypothetical protein
MALLRVFLVIQLLLRFGINTLYVSMDSDLNISTSKSAKEGLISCAARERKRLANQKYYAKKKAARVNDISSPVIDLKATKGKSARNKRAYVKKKMGQATHSVACQSDLNPSAVHDVSCGNDAVTSSHINTELGNVDVNTNEVHDGCCADQIGPSMHVDIEVQHVENVGDSPTRIEGIHGSSVGTLLTTNTNASSYLDSDMSMLDALVGEEGQTSARVQARRRTENQRYYAKRQACNETQSEVTFMADSVEDRNQFGGIYCPNWNKAKELLYTWLEYCRQFFSNAKACANCGKFVFGGKYSMHYGKLVTNVFLFLQVYYCVVCCFALNIS